MSPSLAGDFPPAAAPIRRRALGGTSVGNDVAMSRCTSNAGARFFPAHRTAVNSKCPFKHSSRKRPLGDSRYGLSRQVTPDQANLPAFHPPVCPRKNSTNRFNTQFQNTTRIPAAYPNQYILRRGPQAPTCLPCQAFPARRHKVYK